MKMSKEKRDQIIATVIGTVMVLVAVWMFLVTPTAKSLEQAQTKADESEQNLNNARRLLTRAGHIKIEEAAVGAKLESLEATMVQGDPSLWIRVTLEKFRSQAPYKVEIPSIGQPALGEIGLLPDFAYKGVTYSLTGAAHFHELGKFLADFENAFPYIRVQNLNIAPEDFSGFEGVDRERLAFSFEIVVPLRPVKKT